MVWNRGDSRRQLACEELRKLQAQGADKSAVLERLERQSRANELRARDAEREYNLEHVLRRERSLTCGCCRSLRRRRRSARIWGSQRTS